ncbi:MAG: hypothetical protein KKG59_00285 [Nanoarchaeota archaeon]|nr:hypothetical protein [Nanoarchaeota archaeon]
MKTKGQMEAMGLIIIVLLVLVGIFLLISFGNAKPKDTATGYNEKLINSFVSTLPSVEIAIGDRDLKMKDVIRACKFGTLSNACGELDGALETILDNSLKLWGYHYEFNITAVDIGMVYPDEKD